MSEPAKCEVGIKGCWNEKGIPVVLIKVQIRGGQPIWMCSKCYVEWIK